MDTSDARRTMIDVQIAGRGLRQKGVLEALQLVPRQAFVDPGFEEFAYEDCPLPIGAGQTISQPYIWALMLEAAELRPSGRVLEVGAGSGYAAALMSSVAGRVYAIERQGSLIAPARARFKKLGYENIELGAATARAAGRRLRPLTRSSFRLKAPVYPKSLKRQLAQGGRLIIPVGRQGNSTGTAQDYAQERNRIRRREPRRG